MNRFTGLKKALPGVAVSLVALAVIFYFVDIRQLGQALGAANKLYVGLLVIVSLAWLMVRALLWRTLLQEQAGYRVVFLTLNEGYLLNNVLPFRLGEVGRAFLLGRKSGLGFFEVLSTIIIERALDVGMAAAMLLISLPYVVGGQAARRGALAAVALVLVGLGALFILARNQTWAQATFTRLAERIPFLQRLESQVEAFFKGLKALRDGRRFLKVIGLLLLNWGMAVLQFSMLLKAFFPQAQPLWAMFTLGVMALGVGLPSSPGSIGVMEAAVMGALAAFVNDPPTALAAALTAHITNYLLTGLIGAYALGQDGASLGSLYQELRERGSHPA